MVMTPARVAELTNGYEQRTSGLWTHKGKADIGTLRVTQNLTGPGTGVGVEFGYNPSPLDYGFIQAYDRDLNQWRDLYLSGRNVFLNPQGGGVVNMPANSVGTAQIQANAVQQQIGGYVANPGWSTTTPGWNVTPLSVNVTGGGGLLRIEWSTTFIHSVAGTLAQVGLGWAGAVQYGLLMCYFAAANQPVSVSGTFYAALAGAQTISVYVYMYAAGTLSIYGINSTLYVTEQKR